MDWVLWQMMKLNFITPSFPFIFLQRVTATGEAAQHHSWWQVLLLANLAGALGMLPIYSLGRLVPATWWLTVFARYPKLDLYRVRCRSNMFQLQVLLNATSLPDFVSSGLAGCERYSVWRFLLAQLIGRSFHNLPIVLSATFFGRHAWYKTVMGLAHQPILWMPVTIIAAGWWILTIARNNTRAVK